MSALAPLISDNLHTIILGLTICIFLSLLLFIILNMRMSSMLGKYRNMMKGMEGVNLEEMLISCQRDNERLREDNRHLAEQYRILQERSVKSLQKFSVLRFNAFNDTGSDQSFALALLDHNNNGIVLSSLFGRSESRFYAKPVNQGQSSYALSDEEKNVLEQALRQ